MPTRVPTLLAGLAFGLSALAGGGTRLARDARPSKTVTVRVS